MSVGDIELWEDTNLAEVLMRRLYKRPSRVFVEEKRMADDR